MNNSEKMKSELFIVLALVFLLVAVQSIKSDKQNDFKTDEQQYLINRSYLDSLRYYKDKVVIMEYILTKDHEDADLQKLNILRDDNFGTPIFFLSEEDKNFRFETGSYSLDADYQLALKRKMFEIDSIATLYPEYNAIEIIGHTDGRPIRSGNGSQDNIDRSIFDLLEHFQGNGVNENFNISANSNFDLGILRAMSVATFMKQNSFSTDNEQKYLRSVNYWFPYSAGPVVKENGLLLTTSEAKNDLDENNRSRRRIEIRLFKYESQNVLAD